jgi:hypothetical protein
MAIGRITLTAGIDVTIAVTLVLSLHHSKTGFRRYDPCGAIFAEFVLTHMLAFQN